jgi:hypothetical protein
MRPENRRKRTENPEKILPDYSARSQMGNLAKNMRKKRVLCENSLRQ